MINKQKKIVKTEIHAEKTHQFNMATNNVSTIVELNVGGVFYSTSVATLTSEPGSKLALMFDLSELQNNEESTLLKDSKVCHI